MSETMEIIVGIAVGLLLGWGFDLFRKKWNEKHPMTAYQRWIIRQKIWEAMRVVAGLSIIGCMIYGGFKADDSSSYFYYIIIYAFIATIYIAYGEKTRPHTPGSCCLFYAAVVCLTPLFIIPWWLLRIPKPWNRDYTPTGI